MLLITLPAYYYRSYTQITRDMRTLATIIIYAQHCALSSYSPQEIHFDIEHHSYQYQSHSIKLSDGICFGLLPGVKGPPSHPRTVLITPITFENHALILYPNGTVSAGTIYLTDNMYMYALTVPVGYVGHVRTYRYDNTWVEIHD